MHLEVTISLILQPGLALSGLFAILFTATALYAYAVPQGDRRWWGAAGLLAALVLAALLVPSELARMVLLDLAALAAVALVWTHPEARPAARIYLFTLLVSIACTAAGMALGDLLNAETGPAPAYPLDRLAAALLIVGFSLKLALAPFYFWLSGVAASSRPMTTALIVAILGMAEFSELLHLRQAAPWVFTGHHAIWLALALLSMFGGALMALAQRDLKRMLAFSTIDDMGYLLLGLLIGSSGSLNGAILGMASHALFKVLLFGAVGIAEKTTGEPLNLDCRGLAVRFPVSSAMFITGTLGILGIPPLFGFAGRWQLYLAAVQSGGILLGAAMVLATALALLYYVRAIHRVWLGPLPGADQSPSEPRLAAGALIVLAVIALFLGIFPGLFQIVI